MYWLYGTRTFTKYNQEVVAELITPPTVPPSMDDCGYSMRSPLQDEPYSVDLELAFRVNPKHKPPDNYSTGSAFFLYSERLIQVMQQFNVRFEYFPAKLVDSDGKPQEHLRYYVFHSLEGMQDAMDYGQSEWQGSYGIGVPRLVIDYSKFQHRPIFRCALIYVDLMRDDLKQQIQRTGITGFAFLPPEKYRSGQYGFPPSYEP